MTARRAAAWLVVAGFWGGLLLAATGPARTAARYLTAPEVLLSRRDAGEAAGAGRETDQSVVSIGDEPRVAMRVRPPARIAWTIPARPGRYRVRTAVAVVRRDGARQAPIVFQVLVSSRDGERPLASVTVDPAGTSRSWRPITVDLDDRPRAGSSGPGRQRGAWDGRLGRWLLGSAGARGGDRSASRGAGPLRPGARCSRASWPRGGGGCRSAWPATPWSGSRTRSWSRACCSRRRFAWRAGRARRFRAGWPWPARRRPRGWTRPSRTRSSATGIARSSRGLTRGARATRRNRRCASRPTATASETLRAWPLRASSCSATPSSRATSWTSPRPCVRGWPRTPASSCGTSG